MGAIADGTKPIESRYSQSGCEISVRSAACGALPNFEIHFGSH
jgi:hypothetical protein